MVCLAQNFIIRVKVKEQENSSNFNVWVDEILSFMDKFVCLIESWSYRKVIGINLVFHQGIY